MSKRETACATPAAFRRISSDIEATGSTSGAMNGLLDEIIEAHAREHVAHPDLTAKKRESGLDALIEAIRRYTK
jgi:DNA-binding FrmR family transcriptional regulator